MKVNYLKWLFQFIDSGYEDVDFADRRDMQLLSKYISESAWKEDFQGSSLVPSMLTLILQ